MLGNDGSIVLNGGTLNVQNMTASEVIGDAATGVFTHVSGTNNASNYFIGNGTASIGDYLLNAGTLAVRSENIGYFGKGTLTQAGGTHTALNEFIGNNPSGQGTLTVNGGTFTVTQSATAFFVGFDGHGTVNQTAGIVTTNGLVLGFDPEAAARIS